MKHVAAVRAAPYWICLDLDIFRTGGLPGHTVSRSAKQPVVSPELRYVGWSRQTALSRTNVLQRQSFVLHERVTVFNGAEKLG